MEFVQNIDDIIENIKTFEKYLASGNTKKKEFAQSLVKKGRTILVYKVSGQNHFAPSRFCGFNNNTMDHHIVNDEKDGRDTNPIIDRIIGKAFANDKTESKYIDYCAKIGVVPDNVKRRYWRLKANDGKNLYIDI